MRETRAMAAGLAAAAAALAAEAVDGLLGIQGSRRDPEGWRRKKWQKRASGGPGGPEVRMSIPGRRKR